MLPLELNKLLIIVVVLSMALTPLLNEVGKKAAEIIDTRYGVKEASLSGLIDFEILEREVLPNTEKDVHFSSSCRRKMSTLTMMQENRLLSWDLGRWARYSNHYPSRQLLLRRLVGPEANMRYCASTGSCQLFGYSISIGHGRQCDGVAICRV